MTMPIGAAGAQPVTPSAMPGVDGAFPAAGLGSSSLGPSVISGGATLGVPAAGDLAMLVELLQSECSKAAADNETQTAKANAAVKKEQVERKLDQIARAIEKEREAEKWGQLGEVFKWVGVAVAAAAGAAGAIFTGGASAAVAAIVITSILTAQTVVKAAVDEAVSEGSLNERDAHTIMACFGNLQDIVGACLDPEKMTPEQKVAMVALGAVDELAKAVLSCVFSGGSNVTQAIQGVTKVVALGVETTVEAQELIAETTKEGQRTGQLDDNALFALQLSAMLLEICGSVAGACGGAGTEKIVDRGLSVAAKVSSAVGRVGVATADGMAAGCGLGSGLAVADAVEARGRGERAVALGDAARERMKAAVAQLRQILDELEEARSDVDSLLDAGARQAVMAAGPSRV